MKCPYCAVAMEREALRWKGNDPPPEDYWCCRECNEGFYCWWIDLKQVVTTRRDYEEKRKGFRGVTAEMPKRILDRFPHIVIPV